MSDFSERIKKEFANYPDDDGFGIWDALTSNAGLQIFYEDVSKSGLGKTWLGVRSALYAAAALVVADDYDERTTKFLEQAVWNGRTSMDQLIKGALHDREAHLQKARDWDGAMKNIGQLSKEMTETIEDPAFFSGAISLADMETWAKQGKPKFPAMHVLMDGQCQYCKLEYDEEDRGFVTQFCPERMPSG